MTLALSLAGLLAALVALVLWTIRDRSLDPMELQTCRASPSGRHRWYSRSDIDARTTTMECTYCGGRLS